MPSLSPFLSRLSVRERLTGTIALLTTLALVVVGLTLYAVESRRIDRSIDMSLTQEIGEFRALQLENDPGRASRSRRPTGSCRSSSSATCRTSTSSSTPSRTPARRRCMARRTVSCSSRPSSPRSSRAWRGPAARAPSTC